MPTVSRNLLALVLLCTLTTGAISETVPASGPRQPGKFTWFNLATPDATPEQTFYSAVFGWEFTPPPAGARYTIISHNGREIGAIVVPQDPSKAKGTRWISHLSVADAAATARKTTELGGAVLIKPTTVAQHGTHALLRDPDGALFGILQAAAGDSSDNVEANEFFWADLLSPAPAKSAEFYRAVGGYDISQAHLGTGIDRVTLSSNGVKRAGIAPLPKEMKQPGWLPYIVVDDVAATLELVTKAGGHVLLAPMPALLDGNLAIFADPAGGVLGIVKWTTPAAKQ